MTFGGKGRGMRGATIEVKGIEGTLYMEGTAS